MRMVMKFGGSSLSDTERIRMAALRVAREREQGHQVIAVVSAQGDTTDELIEQAARIDPAASAREMDAYLSTGEQMSAGLMAMMLEQMGYPAVSLTGVQAGILTDGVFGNARVLKLRGRRIEEELEQGRIVVVAGFQGVDEFGNITTLGRGGSDTTAVALAAFLQARECRIYTDVDGVYDRDPRIYPEAVRLETVNYEKMLAMALDGAQVLHHRCVEMAMTHGVPIRVLSSFRPGEGTLVSD